MLPDGKADGGAAVTMDSDSQCQTTGAQGTEEGAGGGGVPRVVLSKKSSRRGGGLPNSRGNRKFKADCGEVQGGFQGGWREFPVNFRHF